MSQIHRLILPAIVWAAPAHGATYHTVESAQRACFPEGGEFVSAHRTLSREQKKTLEKSSGSRMRGLEQRIWKVTRDGQPVGWFLVDDVIGKHEYITYAVALNAEGSVKSVEIMDYRENYGSEIQRVDWRRQFVGRQAGDRLELTADILNISGATLSCRHVTNGVKRLLKLHELLLKE